MSRNFRIVLTLLGMLILAIGFGAGWSVGTKHSKELPLPQPKHKEVKRDSYVWVRYEIDESGARKCPPASKRRTYIINKFNCPTAWRPPYDFSELQECQEKLKNIQFWCNPYCQEELEGCLSELHNAELQCLHSKPIWGI